MTHGCPNSKRGSSSTQTCYSTAPTQTTKKLYIIGDATTYLRLSLLGLSVPLMVLALVQAFYGHDPSQLMLSTILNISLATYLAQK